MKNIFPKLCGVASALLLSYVPVVVSSDPVAIFVHGMGGFGPDEMLFLSYWPHKDEFEKAGFVTKEAQVGPLSSDWDRACELYAQIKGVRTDYGIAHSTHYKHDRYGWDYTGKALYPEWNSSYPINLIGHSMGGTTARLLEILLEEGDDRERAAGGDTSELFLGGKSDWVTSVTAIASPHDGSPLVDILGDGFTAFLQTFVMAFAVLAGGTFVDNIYDFQLDHWGLQKEEGESLVSYMSRVFSSPVFDINNEDLCVFDVSAAGAKKLQARGLHSYPSTYYYSIATDYTITNLLDCKLLTSDCSQVGRVTMWWPLIPEANLIGSRRQTESYLRTNDGLVPLNSSKCPTVGYDGEQNCPELKDNSEWTMGTWFWGKVELDHLQIIGWVIGNAAKNVFRDHAERLYSVVG